MNPGEVMVIRQPGPGENPVPTPPAGFIQKDIEIAKLQNERILSHIYTLNQKKHRSARQSSLTTQCSGTLIYSGRGLYFLA